MNESQGIRTPGVLTGEVILGDCIEVMAKREQESVDLVVTDPPFAIDFNGKPSNYNRHAGLVLEGYHEVKPVDYRNFTFDWMQEAVRLMKEDASMYVFSGWNFLEDILFALRMSGLKVINHVIWKYNFGVYCEKRYVTSHYHLLYVCKNPRKRKFYSDSRHTNTKNRYHDLEDVWEIKREYWKGEVKTPTKLPTEVVRKCIEYSSKEGDLVLDPFAGSGQVPHTAMNLHRKYLAIEEAPEFYRFMKDRGL